MKMKHSNSGFTLVELLVVLVLLGIIAVMVLPSFQSGTAKANAELKLRVVNSTAECLQAVHSRLGWGSDVLTNSNYESGNDGLDMCATGEVAVASAQQDNFNRVNGSGLPNLVQVRTAATAGTNGTYFVGSSQVTLSSSQPTRQLSMQFTNTPAEEVCEIMAKLEGFDDECDTSTAKSTGVVQYTAASGGTNTLTVLRTLIM